MEASCWAFHGKMARNSPAQRASRKTLYVPSAKSETAQARPERLTPRLADRTPQQSGTDGITGLRRLDVPCGRTMKSLESSSRTSLKNILFATDLSPAAEWALPFALELARRYRSKLYAVHVIQLDVSPGVGPSQRPKVAQEQEESQNQARRLLQEQLRDIPHEVIFPWGEVWPALSAVIGEKQADLLVASTNGRSGFKAPAFGSVAQEIFQQAPCPVLTVGPSVPSRRNIPVELKRILYATDFTFESVVAVHLAISLALEYGAQLILLHAMVSADSNHEAAALQTLRDLVPFGVHLVPKPKCLVVQGDPPSCILKVASAENANMIVLGLRSAKGHFAAPSQPVRSNARKIAIAAACPVLTVRD